MHPHAPVVHLVLASYKVLVKAQNLSMDNLLALCIYVSVLIKSPSVVFNIFNTTYIFMNPEVITTMLNATMDVERNVWPNNLLD